MLKLFSRLLIFSLIIFSIVVFQRKPSNDRDWTADMERLARVRVESREGREFLRIENIRNSSYVNEKESISFYSDEFDLDRIERMWFMVEPFSKWEVAAHTFFVFDFEDGQTLAFSVEARKEKDEKYSVLRGLFREYELYYTFGSEKDLILRRTNWLDNDVYMYPVKISKENLQDIFKDIVLRAHELETSPEFYNTLTSSCTTTLVRHVNEVSPGKVKWWQVGQYLPGLSDRLAYSLDLIDTELSFEDVKERVYIKDKANNCANSDNFSLCLRGSLGVVAR